VSVGSRLGESGPARDDQKARGSEEILLDCIGFTERHRAALQPVGIPVILPNAAVAKVVSELLGG
jgi:protein AroM